MQDHALFDFDRLESEDPPPAPLPPPLLPENVWNHILSLVAVCSAAALVAAARTFRRDLEASSGQVFGYARASLYLSAALGALGDASIFQPPADGRSSGDVVEALRSLEGLRADAALAEASCRRLLGQGLRPEPLDESARLGGWHPAVTERVGTVLEHASLIAIRTVVERLSRAAVVGQLIVPHLRRLLGDARVGVRALAVSALRELGRTSAWAVGEIEAALTHDYYDVCCAAGRALGDLAGMAVPAVPKLAVVLLDERWASLDFGSGEIQSAAEHALIKLAPLAAQAVPVLMAELSRKTDCFRFARVVKVLRELGKASSPAIVGLIDGLASSSSIVRCIAAKALGGVGGEAAAPAVPQLIALIDTAHAACPASSRSVCIAAIEALGQCGAWAAPAIQALAHRLHDTRPEIKTTIIETLAYLGEASAPTIPRLVELLEDADENVRLAAVKALGALGEHSAGVVPELVRRASTDDSADVRHTAASALRALDKQGVAVIDYLTDALLSKECGSKLEAVQALHELGTAAVPAIPALATLLIDHDANIRNAARVVLPKLRGASGPAIPVLAKLLRDESNDICCAAAQALRLLGDAAAGALPELAGALLHPTAEVRCEVALVFEGLGEAAAPSIPRLAELLQDREGNVRYVAMRVLGDLGGVAMPVAPQLAALLGDDDSDVRAGAVRALGLLGELPGPVVEQVAELRHSPNEGVRFAAAKLVDKLGKPAKGAVPSLEATLDDLDDDIRCF